MTATQDWSEVSLLELFRLEVETQVNELNQCLLTLEQQGSHHRESLDTLMRAAHSIKGAARIVQVEAAVIVAHALEDYFVAVQQGTLTFSTEHTDRLLQGVDFISRLSTIEESAFESQLPAYQVEATAIVAMLEALSTEAIATQSSPPLEADETDETDCLPAPPAAAIEPPSPQPSPPQSDQPLPPTGKTDTEGYHRMVRISTENLNRLMGLAGESLVESNWLQPFAESLLHIKRQQQTVISLLEKQQQHLAQITHPKAAFPGEYLPPQSWGGALELDNRRPQYTLSHETLGGAIEGLQNCHQLLNEQISHLDAFSRRFGQLSDRLYREVISSHMCAFEEGTKGYGRLCRDLAKKLGKQVNLEIKGLMTQVDRDILERLDAPITHLLTNAIAHGIESPAERLAKGKPAQGSLRLEALHRSGMLIVILEDDGQGIDFESLRHKIVEKGLTTAAVAEQLSEPELIEFLFLPGFSTACEITDLAGRGYGLDLARNMAQSVGGALQAFSPARRSSGTHPKADATAGGTCFQFQLPLTLSVLRSLLFEVAGEPYALGLARIERVIRLKPEQIHTSESRPYFSLEKDGSLNRGRAESRQPRPSTDLNGAAEKVENISLVSARQLLALGAPAPLLEDELVVVIMGEAGNRYGLWIDRLLEERDLVVRPLDPRLGKVPNISAAALTETGEPVLILDVADVVRSAEKIATEQIATGSSILMPAVPSSAASPEPADKETSTALRKQSSAERSKAAGADHSPAQDKRVLVVDDSMTVRAMEKKLLQNHGYQVDIAVNGAEGWNAVRMQAYDLVITDVDMPRMSGIELIGHIRAYGPTQRLPVIVVSYKDREEDQLAGLNAGANYYLTKSSFHDDGLINAVRDLIGPGNKGPIKP